ncbi:uncharacterized protein LOC124173167 [Ischnura elegans]|uniref:uncharacterized protein LOC124173167 n=1 Tax=Ischnura elegans TaxID=197161 RepID=UPI001ED88B71|nr:uncharacterized protein LOC124173167 [Ischnura elegans]
MYFAYVRYVEDKKTEIVPQTRVKHLDGEKFSPESDVDFELTKLYLVKWAGGSGSSEDEEEVFYEARVLRICRSESSLKKWVRTNCEERRLAVRKIPFSPEPEKTAGSSRAEKVLAKRVGSAEAQKKRKLSIQTARKTTQSEILQRNADTDRRKIRDRTEESKEISRLRRRLQEAEEIIKILKEEKEEYKRQFIRLSTNLADISSINVELHRMIAGNRAAVSSGRINGHDGTADGQIHLHVSSAAVEETEGRERLILADDGANVNSISGAALKEKVTSTEVLSLPCNGDDDFVLDDPMDENKENSELIHDVVVDNASKEPEVCSLNDDKTEIYMGHNIWLSTEQWNGVRSNSDD